MSAVADTPGKTQMAYLLWQAPIGKKAVMAVTGLILFGFVIGHMIGNLQIYLGREKINAYGALLHSTPALLWGARLTLLLAVTLHIVAAAQLTLLNWRARPVGYVKKVNAASNYASRTMIWSGPIIAAFVVFHLLHFTLGTVHPSFQEEGGIPLVYENVVAGFQQIPVSLFYIIAMALLGFHLHHGVWSMFQSFGVSHPRYTPLLKRLSAIAAIVIVGGNISIPISVMLGFIR